MAPARRLASLVAAVTFAATLSSVGPGTGTALAAIPDQVPKVANGLTMISPTRLMDTRVGLGAPGPVAAGATVSLQLDGMAGLPQSGVYAAILTVSVTQPTAAGYITVYPDGPSAPTTSSMNFTAGRTLANTIITPVYPDGKVDIYNAAPGTVQLVVDISGYTTSPNGVAGAGGLEDGTPQRILDTRSGLGGFGPVPAHGTLHLNVEAQYGLPLGGVSFVLLNLTVTGATAPGYVTAYPDGTARPATSNVDFAARAAAANTVLVPLSAGDVLDLYNGSDAPVQMIADLSGFVLPGKVTGSGGVVGLAPARLLDTSHKLGASGPVAGHGFVDLAVAGRGGVPRTGVTAVVMTLTVSHPANAGFIRATADDATSSATSNLDFATGQTIANMVVVPVGPDGKVVLYNGSTGSTQLIADVSAYVMSSQGIASISDGAWHALALQNDGTVWSWGSNPSGELGDGTRTNRPEPVQVHGLTDVTMVSGGISHSLALRSDGSVWTWGDDIYGEQGNGPGGSDETLPLQVTALSGVVAVAAGGDFSMALTPDGHVWTWGRNDAGQLGDGTTTQRSIPVQVPGVSHVVAVAAGASHALALASDGTVWAWGDNTDGQVGIFTVPSAPAVPSAQHVAGATGIVAISAAGSSNVAVKADGTAIAWGSNADGQLGTLHTGYQPQPVIGINAIKSLVTGGNATFALRTDGSVWAWGDNLHGELGDGTTRPRSTPEHLVDRTGATGLAAGLGFTTILEPNGTALGWGDNEFGSVGDGTTTTRLHAVPVAVLTPIVDVGPGIGHTVALASDGTVWAWGLNDHGQVGDGSATQQPTPVQVAGLDSATQVSAGDFFSLAVRSDGTLWSWGVGAPGVLGNGGITSQAVAQPVAGLSNVVTASAGVSHALALKRDGSVWAWGYNGNGEVGEPTTTTTQRSPLMVQGLANIVAVSAGSGFSLALRGDGTVWAWGLNAAGQLGDGTTTSRAAPVQVLGLTGVTRISAGTTQALALEADGTVWAWGDDSNGQLGDGGSTNQSTPVQVPGLTDAVAVSAGRGSAAVDADGTLWTWGWNYRGGLGNGLTSGTQATPAAVTGIAAVTSIAASENWLMTAITDDGTMLAWGANDTGQVGDGTTTDRSTPVPVAGP